MWKVLPQNKRLTLSETINLARYHHARTTPITLHPGQHSRHQELLNDTRKLLVRHGVHAYGEPADLDGIVVFAADRIIATEIVITLPHRIHRLAPQHEMMPFENVGSLAEMQVKVNKDCSPTIKSTRRWMAESNAALCAKST